MILDAKNPDIAQATLLDLMFLIDILDDIGAISTSKNIDALVREAKALIAKRMEAING